MSESIITFNLSPLSKKAAAEVDAFMQAIDNAAADALRERLRAMIYEPADADTPDALTGQQLMNAVVALTTLAGSLAGSLMAVAARLHPEPQAYREAFLFVMLACLRDAAERGLRKPVELTRNGDAASH